MKIGIVGTGPAGISCAYQLVKRNIYVDVYESASIVGGMAKTIELWGQKVDLGPHRFFSSDPRINQLWLEVVGNDYEMVDRLTRIYYKKKFFYYPLKPFDALLKLGFFESARCLFSYVKEKISPTEQDGTFENWVVNRFGRRLFEIFFKAYTEKLWGISCRELDSDFAAQRIKKLSMYEAIKNAIIGGKNNEHKTLVDQFAYPIDGTGAVYQRMAKYVQKHNGNVFCSTPVRRVINENNTVVAIETVDGKTEYYDHVISTMPITQLIKGFSDVPPEILELTEILRYRNTILVYLWVDRDNLFSDNWLYIHSSDLLMGRMTNFKNWVPTICKGQSDTILALEYWCFDNNELWVMDDEKLISMAGAEVKKTGLLNGAKILDGYICRISKSYPVYYKGYREQLKKIEDYLDTIDNVTVIGRSGSFKYNNQDHSILMGILAAENISDGAKHDLWNINTDDEYQESSVITKSGLQKK